MERATSLSVPWNECLRSPDCLICSLERRRGGRAITLSNIRRTSRGEEAGLGKEALSPVDVGPAAMGAAEIGEGVAPRVADIG